MNSYNFINEIQNDKLKTVLIKVEALQKEYEVTLQQYQEAGKNYITALQSVSVSNSVDFASLKGRTWWGVKGLKEGTVTTEEECKNMCASQNECSGATFNPVKRYCWTRSGESLITAGLDDDYALMPKQKAALATMKSLNEKLLSLNEQIRQELTNIKPEIEEQMIEKNEKAKVLNESYNRLLEQKLEMERQLEEYNSIDQEAENQGMVANQTNVSLRFWVLITSLVLLVTLKRMFGSESAPMSIIFWLLIIIVLIVLTYSLSVPSGFMMWFLLLLGIIMMKTGNLPSL
jgi:hypothetical protein